MKNRINKLWALSGGGLLVLIAFWVKCTVPSPYLLLHNTESLAFLPPLWILGLCWYGCYFLVGGATGHIFSLVHLPATTDVKRFKGGMFFVLAVVFSFVWYLLLFGLEAFFISWLTCILSSVFACICVASWLSVHKGCACAVGVFIFGYFLLVILQLAAMLHL